MIYVPGKYLQTRRGNRIHTNGALFVTGGQLKPAVVPLLCRSGFCLPFLFSPHEEKASTCAARCGEESVLSPEGTNMTQD